MKVNITMPDLTRLEAKGAGKMHFVNFRTDNLELEILGAMKINGEFHVENLNATVSGASELDLQGDSRTMDCTVQGASSLKAYNFEVEDATVNAHGASHAKVNVTGTLEMNKGIASSIDYKGNPTVTKED